MNLGDNNESDYYTISPQELLDHSYNLGIFDNSDIEILYDPYIKNLKNILEVGGGYGRVIDSILLRGYQGEISVIEKNPVLFEYLDKKYLNKKQINITKGSILSCNFISKFQASFFLWSVFAEFSCSEQYVVLENLISAMEPSGLIFIEFPDFSQNVFHNNEYHYVTVAINDRKIKLSFPSEKKLKQTIKDLPISILSIKKYKTTKGYNRKIFILKFA